MKRRRLLALVASSPFLSVTARAQVPPNQPTVEPEPTRTPALITISGTGWSAAVAADRVKNVNPVDEFQTLVSFYEPEKAKILVFTQHERRSDVFMTGQSGIQPAEDYFDTQLHIRTWKALRSKFEVTPAAVAVDDAGAPLEFLSHDHSWAVLYYADKKTLEYFEIWSLPNNTTLLLNLGESFFDDFNANLGNLMYLRSTVTFDTVTFPDSPVPFPNLDS